MAIFNFFKRVPNQKFKYNPRYYDQRKEELEARLKAAEEFNKLEDPEKIKQRLKGSFSKGGFTYYDKKEAGGKYFNNRRSQQRQSNVILLLTIVGLILLCYVVLYVYLPRIEEILK